MAKERTQNFITKSVRAVTFWNIRPLSDKLIDKRTFVIRNKKVSVNLIEEIAHKGSIGRKIAFFLPALVDFSV